jgi:hypothetical protein
VWLHEWRKAIAALGIRVDSILRSRQPTLFANFAAKHECIPFNLRGNAYRLD